MPNTADGITYPASTGSTNLWTHFQNLADTVQARFNRPTSRFLGAGELAPTRSAQVLRDTGTLWAMWECAEGQNHGASNQLLVPPGWTNVAIDLYWTLITAGAGNVAWRGFRFGATDGVALTDGTLATIGVAVPALDTLKVTTLTASTGVTPGDVLHVGAERRGADALDTSAGLAAIIGLNVRPV